MELNFIPLIDVKNPHCVYYFSKKNFNSTKYLGTKRMERSQIVSMASHIDVEVKVRLYSR